MRKRPAVCKCGAGIRPVKGKLVIAPHSMRCPVLREIVALEKRGICASCGAKKQKRKYWDQCMGMVVTITTCPNGHSHSMDWKPPTKSDIKRFGLVWNGTNSRSGIEAR